MAKPFKGDTINCIYWAHTVCQKFYWAFIIISVCCFLNTNQFSNNTCCPANQFHFHTKFPELVQIPQAKDSVPQDCCHFRHKSQVLETPKLPALSQMTTDSRVPMTVPSALIIYSSNALGSAGKCYTYDCSFIIKDKTQKQP